MTDARLVLVSTRPATQGLGGAPDGKCDLSIVAGDWHCPIASGLTYGDIMINYGGDSALATVDADLVRLADGRLFVRLQTTYQESYCPRESATTYALVDVAHRSVSADVAAPDVEGATTVSHVDCAKLPRRPTGGAG